MWLGTSVIGGVALTPWVFAGIPVTLVFAKLFNLYDRDENPLHRATLDDVPGLFQLATIVTLIAVLAQNLIADEAFSRGRHPRHLALADRLAGPRPDARPRAAQPPRAARALRVDRRIERTTDGPRPKDRAPGPQRRDRGHDARRRGSAGARGRRPQRERRVHPDRRSGGRPRARPPRDPRVQLVAGRAPAARRRRADVLRDQGQRPAEHRPPRLALLRGRSAARDGAAGDEALRDQPLVAAHEAQLRPRRARPRALVAARAADDRDRDRDQAGLRRAR